LLLPVAQEIRGEAIVRQQQLIRWACLGAFVLVAALLFVGAVLFVATYPPLEQLNDVAPPPRMPAPDN
jgi:hypothetical protein